MITKLLNGELDNPSDKGRISSVSLLLISLPSIALFVYFHSFDNIRWLDQVVINYLMNSSVLSGDTTLFGSGFVTSGHNPYFYLHRFIAYLSNLIDVPYTSITSASFLLATISSFFLLAKLTSLFTHSLVAILATGVLVALNVNLTLLGTSRLFAIGFAPFPIALPLVLLGIYYFFSGRYSPLFVITSLAVWIHFPSGFYICLILSVYFLVTEQTLEVIKRNRAALIFFLGATIPFFYLVLMQLQSVRLPLPGWAVELSKILVKGHVSFHYLLSSSSIKLIAFAFLAVMTFLSLTVFYKRIKIGTLHEDVAEKIQTLGYIVISLLVVYYVLVDIVSIPFLYKFELLKIFWYISLFLVILIPATTQSAISEILATRKVSPRHLGSILAVMLVLVNLNVLNPFTDRDPNNTEMDWKNITKKTNELPADSIILAPYTRVDYYRFGKRLSPFNYYVSLISFDYSLLPLFNNKFNDFIQDRFLESFVEDVVREPSLATTFKSRIRNAWEQLTIEKLRNHLSSYAITHIIREADFPLDLPIIFKNNSFIVYRLT